MSRPKLSKDSQTERLQIVITADEIKAIEDWQFSRRVASRSEAIRRLIKLGIEADRKTMIAELRQRADELEALDRLEPSNA